MKIKSAVRLLFLALLEMFLLCFISSCSSGQLFPEEPDAVIEEDIVVEDTVPETPLTVSTYYWPWISHGHLDLSNGEIIPGPDLFESDLGFISEFTKDYSYSGQLVWLVEESDVFALEWVTLSFNVEYYDLNERIFDLYYEFTIEDLQPVPGDEGLQEFELNLVDHQEDFEVAITKIVLGKERESNFNGEPICYVALEIEMRVVGNP
ncbi:MAG: hypothetical protein MUP57_00390 [Clostridia bacterium]|nr:hypothetical protein [Clostridia bacterium]